MEPPLSESGARTPRHFSIMSLTPEGTSALGAGRSVQITVLSPNPAPPRTFVLSLQHAREIELVRSLLDCSDSLSAELRVRYSDVIRGHDLAYIFEFRLLDQVERRSRLWTSGGHFVMSILKFALYIGHKELYEFIYKEIARHVVQYKGRHRLGRILHLKPRTIDPDIRLSIETMSRFMCPPIRPRTMYYY